MAATDFALAAEIGRWLTDRSQTLATAESCTGGLIGHSLTQVPGASAYFMGGLIAYANRVKVDILGVDRQALDSHGAVSEGVARQMAEGVRALLGVDIGLGITGIMGPGGGTDDKPVGLAYVGVATAAGCRVQRFVSAGERDRIKELSCRAALTMLRDTLIE